jgi:hypothetical protein
MRSDALHRSTEQNCSSVLKVPTVSLNMAPAEEELTVLPSVASGAYCMEPASAQSRQEQPSSCVCQPTVSAQFGLHTTASEDVTKCFRQGRSNPHLVATRITSEQHTHTTVPCVPGPSQESAVLNTTQCPLFTAR